MATGTDTLDFGATPTDRATLTVAAPALQAADHVEAFLMREATADNTADEHEALAVYSRLVCENDAANDQFRIAATILAGLATGQFAVRWVYAP
jgi:hypothetical protein